jgi:hypothetical protein
MFPFHNRHLTILSTKSIREIVWTFVLSKVISLFFIYLLLPNFTLQIIMTIGGSSSSGAQQRELKIELGKFSGKQGDFANWRFVLRAVMGARGWRSKYDAGALMGAENAQLYTLIVSSFELKAIPILTSLGVNEDDGSALLTKLEAKFGNGAPGEKYRLVHIFAQGMREDEKLEAFLEKRLAAFHQLLRERVTLEEICALSLLKGLPDSLSHTVDLVVLRGKFDMESVCDLIRQKATLTGNNNAAAAEETVTALTTRRAKAAKTGNQAPRQQQGKEKKKDKSHVTCYNCGKKGHYKSECRSAPSAKPGAIAKASLVRAAAKTAANAESEEGSETGSDHPWTATDESENSDVDSN